MRGRVSLVGAGPGDPGLVTLLALDRIKRADVVVYDRLVSREVLELVPKSASKVYGGKELGSDPGPEQLRINRLMLREARAGRRVVRLKGGDPFLFSRGGEEADFLASHGVEFEVVPGVTSALAVPAYAGIPLTHREHSSSVTIVTGRGSGQREGSGADWAGTLPATGSVVVLMGAGRLRELAWKMLDAGRAPATAVAATTWGTTPRQRTVLTTLREAARGDPPADEIEPPCVIVVGAVAALAPRLSWRRGVPCKASRGFGAGRPVSTHRGAGSGRPARQRGSRTRRSSQPRT
ncbi:MAG: uroporphyrinogen-III C-methyltransferase [Nitrososphaerota archaeon]|nr:uroporphyrinogen-III C-methyltransferase [Nitrososphaerota archaeon]MDG6978568.1 uroporphyrinogen-III C-methyltransferase [Nitrososphaerota archaeon]